MVLKEGGEEKEDIWISNSGEVTFGGDHTAVLTFTGVPLPPEAVVVSAELELLPSLLGSADKNAIGEARTHIW